MWLDIVAMGNAADFVAHPTGVGLHEAVIAAASNTQYDDMI